LWSGVATAVENVFLVEEFEKVERQVGGAQALQVGCALGQT
jgi:hypothetical protein